METQSDAEQGLVNSDVIVGGELPMLAHKFSEQGHKIKYPAYIQPKFDGHRCIAIVENGKCTLWSRTRKPIIGVPHITRALEKRVGNGQRMVFDGELYNHQYHDNFEQITRYVNQKTAPLSGHEIVEYHIYDMIIENVPYSARLKVLQQIKLQSPLVVVSTTLVSSEEEALDVFQGLLSEHYEGAMLRNSIGKYQHSRSYDLQKIKEFDDAEFSVIGIEEGSGYLAGHVGSFVCETEDGTTFKAKMKGELKELKRYFEDSSLWKGKKLTVQYQGLTGKNKVPRFPVGLRFVA